MPTKVDVPPLAVYKAIGDYKPVYADFVIWKRLWRTWYGVVVDYDERTGQIAIAFETTPRLLVTMYPEEISGTTYFAKLSDVKSMRRGRWYIMQSVGGNNVWYI